MEESSSDNMVDMWYKVTKEVEERNDGDKLGEGSLLFYTDINYTINYYKLALFN